VAKVTAILEAKDRITPELVKVQRGLNDTVRSIGGIDRNMNRSSRSFSGDSNRMQREIKELRSEINRLGSMNEKARVSVDDQASPEIANIREQLLGLGTIAAGITIGANFSDLMTENEAALRARMKYAAKGKTAADLASFDKESQNLIANNPYLTRSEAMSTLAQSDKLNGKNAASYAETAVKLNVTTDYAPDENLKMMTTLRQSFGVDDAKRLGDSIQYMSNNMKDLKGEFVDSMIEYSTQTSKFLDTPEKMAALVGEMGKMEVWSQDKAFDALKETTIKLTNTGDLTNVLKTGYETQGMSSEDAQAKADKEALMINQLLASNDKTENQKAMGRLMLDVVAIKDKNVQQQVLNELGAGAGEDIGRQFAPLLELAGRLSTGDIKPQIGNEVDKSYKLATENNPLFEYQKAQALSQQSAMDLATTLSKDVTPAFKWAADGAKALADKFNAMPDVARWGVELTALALGGIVLGTAAAAHIKAAAALLSAAKAIGGGPSLGGGGGGGVGGGGGKGGSKRKWYNPRTWRSDIDVDKNSPEYLLGKEKDRLDKKVLQQEKRGGPIPRKPANPDVELMKPDYSRSGLGTGTNWKQDEAYRGYQYDRWANKGSTTVSSTTTSSASKLGFLDDMKNVSKAMPSSGIMSSIKNIGGGLLKKLPYIGTAIGAAEIATSDNKVETAAKVGTEALGGWAGAAAGAATGALVGSVVPVIGTAIGGAVGTVIGGIGGAWGAGSLFDSVKEWWNEPKPTPPPPAPEPAPVSRIVRPIEAPPKPDPEPKPVTINMMERPMVGPPRPERLEPATSPISRFQGPVVVPPKPIPVVPAVQKQEKPKLVSLTIPSMPIALHADGVLQDVKGMIRLLGDPSVSNEIKRIIEKALIDALETAGGPATVGGGAR